MTKNQDIPDIFKNITPPSDDETEQLQKKADYVIDSLSKTYLDNVKVQIQDLKHFIRNAQHSTETEQTKIIKESIFQTAHNIKGQGTTFGYPLLTELGNHICQKIRKMNQCHHDLLEEFARDVTDMETVIQLPPKTHNDTLEMIEKRIKERV